MQRGPRAQRRRGDRDDQAELERAPSSPGALVAADQPGEHRAAGDVGGDRQRRHPRARRQRQADQAVDGDEGDVVGEEEALAERQQEKRSIHRGVPGARERTKAEPGQQGERRGVGAQDARAEADRERSRARARRSPRPARGRLRVRSGRRRARPRLAIAAASASRRHAERALGVERRRRQAEDDAALGRRRVSDSSQPAQRRDRPDDGDAGAAALLARRRRDRLPVRALALRRARPTGAPPSARRRAAGSPPRRARRPSRPARPCGRWPARRARSSPSHASSRSTGSGAPTRTSTSRRPMRTISPGQSAPSLPLKSDERVARLQAQHLDVARRGGRQRDDAVGGERLGHEDARRQDQSFKASSRFSPRRATRRMARALRQSDRLSQCRHDAVARRAPPARCSGRTRGTSSAAPRPGRRAGRRTPCRRPWRRR